ncbi:hypothetical protein [Pectobacterium brasiliense]|uniref:hypothetical protein n=1 Tax=Pectobacterium brasiliense TaxID=180957 RepID=UPI001968F9A5|nr:hypothetical protein [Pectobacterium brasiliense]MBN3171867.1 hypothetical protein [Pectobacterium brasiliense]
MKVSISYWYIKLVVEVISSVTYRVLVKWPSIIVGSIIVGFFLFSLLSNEGIERIYLNVLSSEAESFQRAPTGYMNVPDCVELPTEFTMGHLGRCVNKLVALSDVAHQNVKNINGFYYLLIFISMCIEFIYRLRCTYQMSKSVYGYGYGGAVSAKQSWDE